MPPKTGIDLKFYAALPVHEDPNYVNGFQCDFCEKEFDEGPFFHCAASSTDCCLACAGEPGTPARRHLRRAELQKSQQRASRSVGAGGTAAQGAAVGAIKLKREGSSDDDGGGFWVERKVDAKHLATGSSKGGKSAAAVVAPKGGRSTPRTPPPTAKAVAIEVRGGGRGKRAKQPAPLPLQVSVTRLFFPPPAAFELAAGGPRGTFPLLGYCCEANVFGVLFSDGVSVLVAPGLGDAWIVRPAPSAAADALHATMGRGKRLRAPPDHPRESDDVERVTLGAAEASYPSLLPALGLRTWRGAEKEDGAGVVLPATTGQPPPVRCIFPQRRPAAVSGTTWASVTAGADVPTYVRWCSLVREVEMLGLAGLPQGSLAGRLALLLSNGATQLIDFSRGWNHVIASRSGAADGDANLPTRNNSADEGDPTQDPAPRAALADIVSILA